MLATLGWLALGLLLLALGADSAQKGGSGFALALGIKPVRVGAALLLLGSALPELAFGWRAAAEGTPELAYSVLASRALINLGVLLGALHLLVPLPKAGRLGAIAAGTVVLAAGGFWWQSRNGVISRIEGIAALAVLAALLGFVLARAPRAPAGVQRDLEALAATRSEYWRSGLRVAIGIAALGYGATWLNESSGALAGTGAAGVALAALLLSLPVFGASWFAGWRGFPAVALGLLLGATLADLLLVAGLLAFTEVLPVPEAALRLQVPTLAGLSLLALAACAWDAPSARVKGAMLLLAGFAALAAPLAATGG